MTTATQRPPLELTAEQLDLCRRVAASPLQAANKTLAGWLAEMAESAAGSVAEFTWAALIAETGKLMDARYPRTSVAARGPRRSVEREAERRREKARHLYED
jgi:hypothetical protein